MKEISEAFLNLTLWMSYGDFMSELLNRISEFLFSDMSTISVFESDKNMRFVSWKGFEDLGNFLFRPKKIPVKGRVFYEEVLSGVRKFFGEKASNFLWSRGLDKSKTVMLGPIHSDRVPTGIVLLGYRDDRVITKKMLRDFRIFRSYASMFITLKKAQERERNYQKGVITMMTSLLEMRDPYTLGHSTRVASMAANLARFMGFDRERIDRVYWAGIVHDIGKMGIPESILLKAGSLTEDEFEVVKTHPALSESALSNFSWLDDLKPIVRHHHERWDGTGYPDGISGEDIPLESRIISVVDAYDAMTSDRIYRKALSIQEAERELLDGAGSQFDPYVVRMFLKLLKSRG